MDGPVQIEADRIEWSAGTATAEGAVNVHLGAQSLTGRRATWDGTEVVVEDGVYHRPDGELSFDRAEITPAAGTAVLLGARAETGGATLETARIEVGEGRWTATGATVSPCACTDGKAPALSFTAAAITVVPAKVVILKGGVARVFGVPVLPVPFARVPLNPDHFRLLLPELGWGDYGPSAKVEGRAGVAGWMFQGGPAWRYDRGARGEIAVTAPIGTARGALGWDALAQQVRGAGVSRGGIDTAARVGWDVTVVSDPDYVADYAVDYVSRGVAWRDDRVVLGYGPERLDGWLPDDGSAGALLRDRLSWEIGRGRAASVTPRVGIAAVGDVDALSPLVEVGAGARAAGGTSWLTAEVRGDVAGRAVAGTAGEGSVAVPALQGGATLTALSTAASGWSDGLADGPLARWGAGDTGLSGDVAGEVAVPLWSALGGARIQWWPGARAETRVGWGPDTPFDAAIRAGPAVRADTALADGGIGLDAALLRDASGWRPAASLDVHLAKLSLRLEGDPAVQGGEARWMPGPVTLVLGTTHASALWLSWTDAALALGRLRTGAGASWDLGSDAFAGADVRLGYDDGCAAATLTARFSPDRVLPDLGFAATLRR